jgi:glycerol uptake facilitator-like aquaporin
LRAFSSSKLNVKSQIKKEFLAETFGTFLFFSFASASVAQFIFFGRSGYLTIPLSFGIGLTIGIMVAERISGD